MNDSVVHFSPFPIQYDLGKGSSTTIIHREDKVSICHEHLLQDATPTRLYHAVEKTFIFVLEGELFLKHNSNETQLKKNQGTWLPNTGITVATLLFPLVRLCIIHFPTTSHQPPKHAHFKKMSSGTVISSADRNGVTVWPLYQGEEGVIAIHLYPAHYKETPYYHKNTDQYLLGLDAQITLSLNKQSFTVCSDNGQYIPKKTRKALFNNRNESVSALSIMTPYPEKGRILSL